MNNFDSDALGFGSEGVEPTLLVFMDIQGDPLFVHSSVGYVSWGGEDWLGVGQLGSLEPVGGRVGLAPSRFRLALSGVAVELLGDVLHGNSTWGRLGELHIGAWDGSSLIDEPRLLIRGRLGPIEVAMGGTGGGIGVQIEDVRALLDRVNGTRATLLDHQAESPGDMFYRYLPKMLDHKFTFNGGQFGGNNLVTLPNLPIPQYTRPP